MSFVAVLGTVATADARAQAGAGCALPAQATQRLAADGGVQLAWRAEPEALGVGKPFALIVWTCPREARLVKVDATMPEHRHGMNYRPTIAPLEPAPAAASGPAQSAAPGTWRVQGLLWHMPGRWELRFDVQPPGAEATQVMRQSLELR